MSFFFSKKDFKCHSCNPATDKQTKSESKLNQNILLSVDLLSSCISSSLERTKLNKNKNDACYDILCIWIRYLFWNVNNVQNIICMYASKVQSIANVYLSRRKNISSWMAETVSCNFFISISITWYMWMK
jgi:hypothetical protein